MNEGPAMSGTDDCGADAAAYVLGALEPDELDRFRLHLESCAVCQEEVASLQQLTATLPLAAQQYPAPKAVRRKVMSEVRADARSRSRAQRERSGRVRAPVRRFAMAPALGVVVAALVVAGLEFGSSGASTKVYGASVGDAQLRVTGGHAELLVHKLAEPRDNRIYEVWLKRGPAPRSRPRHCSASPRRATATSMCPATFAASRRSWSPRSPRAAPRCRPPRP